MHITTDFLTILPKSWGILEGVKLQEYSDHVVGGIEYGVLLPIISSQRWRPVASFQYAKLDGASDGCWGGFGEGYPTALLQGCEQGEPMIRSESYTVKLGRTGDFVAFPTCKVVNRVSR